jgi:hypothetical protein
MGFCGDLDGLEFRDNWDGEREDGKEESDVRLLAALPFELVVPFVDGRYIGCI